MTEPEQTCCDWFYCAVLLVGWATNSGAHLDLGFIVVVASLGVRIAVQLSSRRRPQLDCPYRRAGVADLSGPSAERRLLSEGCAVQVRTAL
jgi:hypothetical protein